MNICRVIATNSESGLHCFGAPRYNMSIIAYGMYLLVGLCLLSFNFFSHANIVARRLKYLKTKIGFKSTNVTKYCIRQPERYIFAEVIALYKDKAKEIFMENPFRIRYKESQAVDTGGVARDLFSAFWDIAYLRAGV